MGDKFVIYITIGKNTQKRSFAVLDEKYSRKEVKNGE